MKPFFGLLVVSTCRLDEMAVSEEQAAFQVYGKVQGVFFRKYTQRTAIELGGVNGWIRNTARGTVAGQVACRSLRKCNKMKVWLQSEGSPRSEIDYAEFDPLESENIQALSEAGTFDIKKTSRK